MSHSSFTTNFATGSAAVMMAAEIRSILRSPQRSENAPDIAVQHVAPLESR
jgi:hypothetical protein